MKFSRALAVAAAALTLASGRSRAQATAFASNAPGAPWTVSIDPFASVWFRCLAVVGASGYGRFPLYDEAYAARARREATGTRLVGEAATLRRAIDGDSALELLHFVPLYFVGRAPASALAELRAAASAPRHSSTNPSAAEAIAIALPTPAERSTLLAFLRVVEEEWRRTPSEMPARGRTDTQLDSVWRHEFVAGLAPYFAAAGVEGGDIVVVPALGREGRLIPGRNGRTIIAVGAAAGGVDPLAPLLAAVRELAFPLVRAGESATDGVALVTGGRAAAEFASDVSATRAGALLLDLGAPARAAQYRRLYAGGDADDAAFDRLFPMAVRTELAMRAAVVRMFAARSGHP